MGPDMIPGYRIAPLGTSLRPGRPLSGGRRTLDTFASHLVMRGEPLKVVQELLGHANIEAAMANCHHIAA